MKLFVLIFVIVSICYGINARCLSDLDSIGDCPLRKLPELKLHNIHKIHHKTHKNDNCDCHLNYHNAVVEEPKIEEKETVNTARNYKYNIEEAAMKADTEKKIPRYLFDVRVEEQITTSTNTPSTGYNYQLQAAQIPVSKDQKANHIRYIFDTRIEQPIKPCKEKRLQGLVTKIDAILDPQKSLPISCSNPNHSQGNCNCGCRNSAHSADICDCHKKILDLPMLLSGHEKSHKRIKRDGNKSKKLSLPLKKADIKFPKLVSVPKIQSKSLKKSEKPKEKLSIFKSEKSRTKAVTTPAPFKLSANKQALRLKRKEKSLCGYEFESCDLKRNTPTGCPLCYKCQCEPSKENSNQKFSPTNIRIPYTIVNRDQEFSPSKQQEYDDDAPAYTGLNQPEMYKKYIEQVISKYPEHMSRRMPNLIDQQRNLMEFINELAKNDKSPLPGQISNLDTRYQVLDDAVDLYKLYENAIGNKPNPFGNRKLFNKRGTVLEVIEIDPEDFKKFKLPELYDISSNNSSN